MAITPGKCPPSGCPPFTEKDCIEVFKVYDQCVKEDIAGFCETITESTCHGVNLGTAVVQSCVTDPTTAQCTVISFGPFNPPFFRGVFIQQSVDVKVTLVDDKGKTCTFTLTLQAFNEAFLWAPPGTMVQCNVLSVGPCTCEITGREKEYPSLTICCQAKICKELQIKALVKLLVPAYGFCELPPCVSAPQPEFPCPPEPLFPPQRCQDPPVVTIRDVIGVGIPGVVVTLTRTFDTTTDVESATTGLGGSATFFTKGGFEAGFDVLSFFDAASSKTVVFPIPFEFFDVSGVAHDSATACVIIFQRTAVTGFFTVTIDGFQMLGTIDPQ